MRKQYIAAGLAVVLALFGIIAFVGYANNADDRAVAGMKTQDVLQVVKTVPSGTAASALGGSVAVKKLPKSAIAEGAVSNLAELDGLVTTTDLQPGEQLIAARFAKAGAKSDNGVPKGFQEVTIPLTKARLVGGTIRPGDRVGIVTTYEKSTNMALMQVLVTRFETARLDGVMDESATAEITFAVKTLDAEKIVNAAEAGKVWLTKQNDDTDTSGGASITPKDVNP